jgi:G:T/U-mismatch repair DNA glycosylase
MAGGLPDILAPDLSVVFCGLNPGVNAAATGHHFLGRGNRFWQVIHLAGFTPMQIAPEHDASVLAFGVGLTTLVERPTPSAIELGDDEFVAGGLTLRRKIERLPARQSGSCPIQAAATAASALRHSLRRIANFAAHLIRRRRSGPARTFDRTTPRADGMPQSGRCGDKIRQAVAVARRKIQTAFRRRRGRVTFPHTARNRP